MENQQKEECIPSGRFNKTKQMSLLKCARPRIARGKIDARKFDLSLVKVPFLSALRFHAVIDTLKVNNSGVCDFQFS